LHRNKGEELAMGSFGERLRREREMRGITLNEIGESTKISRRHLESLEKEDFESLPGGIFNKGFVRAYARYLGIDEEQAVADYSAAANEQEEPGDKFPLEIHPEPNPKLNPKRSTLPLILALLALVAVLAVFWARNKGRSLESTDTSSSAPAGTPHTAATPAPASPSPQPETPSPSPQIAPAAQSSPSFASRNPAEVMASANKTASPEHTFSVMVTAKEDAWVLLKADGKTVLSRKLNAGEQQSVRAGSRVVLVTGNAGGVDVSFNGKALGAVGNESQVRTLTFTSTGLVQ
jgi:cytoskeleton protein RodZ